MRQPVPWIIILSIGTAPLPRLEARPATPLRASFRFVENRGQWNSTGRFLLHGPAFQARLEEDALALLIEKGGRTGATLRSPGSAQRLILRFAFEGSAALAIEGEERMPGLHHFLVGKDCSRWAVDVPSYVRVIYRGLYDGIDLEFREESGSSRRSGTGHIEYDFVLSPGADLSQVVLRVEGSEGLYVDDEGALVIKTRLGALWQLPPTTWQVLPSGQRCPLACRYRLIDEDHLGFEVPGLDPELALVIDPILEGLFFVGGSSDENAWDAATLENGDWLLCGGTISWDFPLEPVGEVIAEGNAGANDAFVSRFDGSSGELVFSTTLGGSTEDGALAVAEGPPGHVTLAGGTDSNDLNVTNNSEFSGVAGEIDGWVARINDTGTELEYATYLGALGEDLANAIAVDAKGDIVVSGYVSSAEFPVTQGAFQTEFGGGANDRYVAKIHPALGGSLGSQLQYCTFLGGSGNEAPDVAAGWSAYDRFLIGSEILVLEDGSVYLTGMTNSRDYPTTLNAIRRVSSNPDGDCFLSCLVLNRNLSREQQLPYSTLFGGSVQSTPNSLARDPISGDIWVAGATFAGDFPTTPGAYATPYQGQDAAFFARIDPRRPTNEQIVYSGTIDGTSYEGATGVKVRLDGIVVLTGFTWSSGLSTTDGAISTDVQGGPQDGWLACLNPDPALAKKDQLLYFTYLGGGGRDVLHALALFGSGDTLAAGQAESFEFAGVPDVTGHGNYDAVAVKLDLRFPHAALNVTGPDAGGIAHFDAAASTTPNGTGALTYEWDFGDGTTSGEQTAEHAYTSGGRICVRLTVRNNLGLRHVAQADCFSVPCPAGDAVPWVAVDVGEPALTGTARLSGAGEMQALEMCAGGTDLTARSDQIHFAYQELEGDGSLTAELTSLSGGDTGALAGLMCRESLDAGSRHVAMIVQRNADRVLRFKTRSTTNGSTSGKFGGNAPDPAWLRIERKGNVIAGSYSTDGESWTELSQSTFDDPSAPLPENLLVGFVDSAGDKTGTGAYRAGAASFAHIALVPASSPEPGFLRADADGSLKLDITDAVFTLGYLFLGGPTPSCLKAADADDSGKLEITDVIFTLGFLFLGSAAPPAPTNDCGLDPTTDELPCETSGC